MPQMLFLPRSRVTVSAMHSNWIFVPLSIMYAALLLHSWTPDTLQLIMPGSLQAGLTGCCLLSPADATTSILLHMLRLFAMSSAHMYLTQISLASNSQLLSAHSLSAVLLQLSSIPNAYCRQIQSPILPQASWDPAALL